ncbi:MAG TPA: response regulator, partial [Candidatus Hydrogenedentes bacterium]|nr:response regulator [Candidatus Hydrogenedentota bacterium]
RLPGMDGHDAIIALHMRLPQLCFLIHTGSLSYGLTDDLLALGITEERLFRKPLQDMAALAATVRSLLGGGQ